MITKQQIVSTILNLASKKRQIVYGQQSINQQIPMHLKRDTKDYDIITSKPESAAKALARELNEIAGKNRFKVEKGKYYRTFKVKDDSGETIVDYTRASRYPKTVNVLGVRYADLDYSKRKISKILRDKNSSFRWEKDRDTLKRIKRGTRKVW